MVERDSLEEQSDAIARGLPRRPLVLGGCCCAHVGAIRGLAGRHERLAVVWLDAHGDLNTPESSPSGNLWGMPLRMAIDEGSVDAANVALVGARDLDPPEAEYVAEHGIDDDLVRAVDGVAAAYVALDVDVLEPGTVPCFMPVPGGPGAGGGRGDPPLGRRSGARSPGSGSPGSRRARTPRPSRDSPAAAGL